MLFFTVFFGFFVACKERAQNKFCSFPRCQKSVLKLCFSSEEELDVLFTNLSQLRLCTTNFLGLDFIAKSLASHSVIKNEIFLSVLKNNSGDIVQCISALRINDNYRYKDVNDSVSFVKKKDASKLIKSAYHSSFLHPAPGGPISSYFGMRKHPITGAFRMHKGVDFAHNTGTPIKASISGFVEYIGYNGGYGNFIKMHHANELKTAYAHMSKFKSGIKVGSYVSQGEVIGYVGSTGSSTAPHLHYEVIKNGKHVDPLVAHKSKLFNKRDLKDFRSFKIQAKKIDEMIKA